MGLEHQQPNGSRAEDPSKRARKASKRFWPLMTGAMPTDEWLRLLGGGNWELTPQACRPEQG